MENLTPTRYRDKPVDHQMLRQIMSNLLSAIRFEKVSFTGGEPLTNPRLHELAAAAYELVPRLELNTNGVLLTSRRWEQLRPWFTQVKVSIDTLDSGEFEALTAFKGRRGLEKVLAAVDIVRGEKAEVVLNGVVMRRNLDGVYRLIDYVIENGLWLHLLDFNFTPECADEWEREFVPNEELIDHLTTRFGAPFEVPRFGCGYFEFYPSPSAVVRLRTSYCGTMRSVRCASCSHYCQTGLFGLRLSTQGWVTYCFSDAEIDGVLLDASMSIEETREAVLPLVRDIAEATLVPDSLQIMIDRRRLSPKVPFGSCQISRTIWR
jgi:molybdenum cofactor biosynthesis enzyme MoaA